MTTLTLALCKRARLQWLNAFHRRTGDVCIFTTKFTTKLEKYFPPYIIDKNGYGVDFVKETSNDESEQ